MSIVINANRDSGIQHCNDMFNREYIDFSSILVFGGNGKTGFTNRNTNSSYVDTKFTFRNMGFSRYSISLPVTIDKEKSIVPEQTIGREQIAGSSSKGEKNRSVIQRILVDGYLDSGILIGKKIKLKGKISQGDLNAIASSSSGSVVKHKISLSETLYVRVFLLHKDGSKTEVNKMEYDIGRVSARIEGISAYDKVGGFSGKVFSIEGESNGVMSQEGDYLYVEFEIKTFGIDEHIQGGTDYGLLFKPTIISFGSGDSLNPIENSIGGNGAFGVCPVQISIE